MDGVAIRNACGKMTLSMHQRYTPVGGSMHRLFDNQMVWQDAIQEHQDIYEAIADRDPLQAQAAMQRHLARAHIRLMAVIG